MRKTVEKSYMGQIEIKEPVPVFDESGRPANFGWSKAPCFLCDQNYLSASRFSISEGDRYILISPTHLVLLEILDDGYLGYNFVTIVSYKERNKEKNCSSQTFVTPFSMGSFSLPWDSETDSVRLNEKKILLNFANTENGVKIIKADVPKFHRGQSLRGAVVLTPPEGAESLVTNMPWRGESKAFSCLRRSPWYSAEGVIQFGTKEIVFTQGNGWGIFDWSRGIRPRSDLRFWATGCGKAEGHQFGFSVGYSSADSSTGTENAIFIDGKIHKLHQVSFYIPSAKLEPWHFTSNDNRFEMEFKPVQERDESHQMFFHSMKRRQIFGYFNGKVVLDDNSEFKFEDIAGMAERRQSRL